MLIDNTFPNQDFLTFQDYANTFGNTFGIGGKYVSNLGESNYNNVFFSICRSNISHGLLRNNTFVNRTYRNDFGVEFINNIILDLFKYNRILDHFYNNTITSNWGHVTVGMDFGNFVFPIDIPEDALVGSSGGGSGDSNHPAIVIWQDGLLLTPMPGSIEYMSGGTNFYGTDGTSTRKTFAWLESPAFTTPDIGVATGTSLSVTGDIKNNTEGGGLYIKEGVNATMGVATLVGGTVTVSTTKVTANSRIFLTPQSMGTILRPVGVGVTARVVGTSFTITSQDATDTSVIAWQIVEPS